MYRRIKVKLYPNKNQVEMLERHFDGYRFTYNLCLEYKRHLWSNYHKCLSAFDMQKEIFEIRKESDWLIKCKAECIRDAALNVDKSYKNFFKGKGFPKFKSKRGEQSFFAYQSISCTKGKVKFYKNSIKFKTSKNYEELLELSKIKQVTFKRDLVGDYWASFLIEDKTDLTLPKNENNIAIDLGIKHLAITSDGEYFENKKFLENNYYKLRRLQRRFSKTKKGSSNREKLRIKIAKLHRKIFRQKEHYYHQITNKLIRENQTICIETLKVKKMIEEKKLSRLLSDASFGMFTQMLEYKCNWYGRELVKIDTYFPSSKTCSNCGHIKEDLKLSDRVYKCNHCDLEMDRDYNASLNILKEGLRIQKK